MIDLLHPPRTILEVWESLPEGTLFRLINNKIVKSPSLIDKHRLVPGDIYFERREVI